MTTTDVETQRVSRRRITLMLVAQVAVRLIGLASGLLGVAVVARSLGREDFGSFSICLMVLGIATTACELGLTAAAVREYSIGRIEQGTVAAALLLGRIVSSACAFVISVVILLAVLDDTEFRLAGVIILASLLFAPLTTGQAWGQARLRLGSQNALLVAQSILWPFFVCIVAAAHGDPTAFAAAFAASVLIHATLVFLIFRRSISCDFRDSGKALARLLRIALPLALSGIFITVYYRLSGVILYEVSGASPAADFAAGLRVIDALQAIPATLLVVVLPLLSRTFADGRGDSHDSRARLFDVATRAVLAVAVPVAVGGATLAGPLLELLYGSDFAAGTRTFAMLLLSFPAICLGYLVMSTALAAGQTRPLTLITGVVAVLNLTACLVLVPAFGAEGAAGVTVVTEWTIFVSVMAMISRRVRVTFPFDALFRVLASTGPMAGLVFVLRELPLFLVIPAGASCYLALAVALGAIHRRDLRILMSKSEVIA